jgi:hypothetical protein
MEIIVFLFSLIFQFEQLNFIIQFIKRNLQERVKNWSIGKNPKDEIPT